MTTDFLQLGPIAFRVSFGPYEDVIKLWLTLKCLFCEFSFAPPTLPSKSLLGRFPLIMNTEVLHHSGDNGHGRGQPQQCRGAGCHHHQREEPAATVGEGQLRGGHPREHHEGHTHRGAYVPCQYNNTLLCSSAVDQREKFPLNEKRKVRVI